MSFRYWLRCVELMTWVKFLFCSLLFSSITISQNLICLTFYSISFRIKDLRVITLLFSFVLRLTMHLCFVLSCLVKSSLVLYCLYSSFFVLSLFVLCCFVAVFFSFSFSFSLVLRLSWSLTPLIQTCLNF